MSIDPGTSSSKCFVGTELQRYLIGLCKSVERKYLEQSHYNNYKMTSGSIPLKMLINALMSSERLGLSRLQVLMICSEANVMDGFVNIHQFVPMAVKM